MFNLPFKYSIEKTLSAKKYVATLADGRKYSLEDPEVFAKRITEIKNRMDNGVLGFSPYSLTKILGSTVRGNYDMKD